MDTSSASGIYITAKYVSNGQGSVWLLFRYRSVRTVVGGSVRAALNDITLN